MDKGTVNEARGLLKKLIDVLGEKSIHAQVIVECIGRDSNEEMIEEWLQENCETDISDKFAKEYLEITKEYNEKMGKLIVKIDRSEEDECE